jgi:hypothetical protein
MAKTSGKKSTPTVTIDQRKKSDRRGDERRGGGQPVSVERRAGERRAKVVRRRQIDPTTCERDYSPEEVEFMHALEQYKRANGRMFPTCSEVLEVLRGLGYEKLNRAGQQHVDHQPSADPCRCDDGGETLPACPQE